MVLSEKRLNVAVVGCGVIGSIHMDMVGKLEGCETVHVCDVNGDLARAVAQERGIARWGDQAQAVFGDPEVDVVILALPTFLRKDLTIQALKSGKHVLSEKPAAMNFRELQEIKEHIGDRKLAFCSSRMSLLPHAQRARAAIAAGEIGALRTLRCRAVGRAGKDPGKPYPAWRQHKAVNGGGILTNWGPYDMDFLFSLAGWDLEPLHVLGKTWSASPGLQARFLPSCDVESHACAFVTFSNGVTLQYDRGENFVGKAEEEWEIIGDKGSIRLHMYQNAEPVVLYVADAGKGTVESILYHEPEVELDFHLQPLKDLKRAIEEDAEPQCGIDEAMLVTRLCDAIYNSSESNKPVFMRDLE
jgi:predicted dehydrogenase